MPADGVCPAITRRRVGLFSSSTQIGAALAGSIFGFLLARYDSFPLIWAVCAALTVVRLALFIALVLRDRLTARNATPMTATLPGGAHD